MATKIRLARHGKKDHAFYHVVVADSRAPRDGKFIEKLGTYNPNTNPATVEINFERALYWVGVGAQPTDTTRSILSGKGVMYMHHLLGGVKKGAFSEAEAKNRFDKWIAAKEAGNEKFVADLAAAKAKGSKDRLAAETAAKEKKAAAVASKLAEAAAAVEAVEEVAEAGETAEEALEAVVEAVEGAAPEAAEEAPAVAEEAPAAE